MDNDMRRKGEWEECHPVPVFARVLVQLVLFLLVPVIVVVVIHADVGKGQKKKKNWPPITKMACRIHKKKKKKALSKVEWLR